MPSTSKQHLHFSSYFCIKLSDIKDFGKRRIAYCLYSVDDSENLYYHVIIIIYTCDLTVFGRLFGVFLLTVVFFKSYVDVTCAGVTTNFDPWIKSAGGSCLVMEKWPGVSFL